jgi:hypothetical protein
VRRTDHGANDPVHLVEVPEASRAAVALHDLLDRAAEVDVDELGSVVLRDQPGRLGHGGGVGTIDLNADGTLHLLELGTLKRGADPAPDGLRREEFGDHDVGTHPPAHLAVWRLGDAGHGCEDERKPVLAREGQLHGRKILGARVGGNERPPPGRKAACRPPMPTRLREWRRSRVRRFDSPRGRN